MENRNRSVTIRVKSASYRCEDLEIPCDLTYSVRRVKEIIRDQYPLHPEVKEQRLIFSGHLLDDNQILRDVLLPNSEACQTSFTLHLACSSKVIPQRTEPLKTPKTAQTNATTSERPSAGQFPSHNPQSENGVPQNVVDLHQLYVQQMMVFMNQWSQYYTRANPNMNYRQGPFLPQMTMPNNPYSYQNIPQVYQRQGENINQGEVLFPRNEQGPEIGQAAEVIPPQVPQAPPPPVVRPQNVVNEEDEQPRDILDWIYTISRLFLIFSVVYFYANLTRFFLVVVFTALVLILQRRPGLLNNNGAAARQERPPEREAGAAAAANNRDDVPVQENNENRRNETVEAEGAQTPPDQSAGVETSRRTDVIEELPQAPRYYIFNITWTFVTTFFSSLIPEMQAN